MTDSATALSLVPVVDIAPYLAGDDAISVDLARQIDRACSEVGFLIVVGHGVPTELINRARTKVLEFYSQPPGVKNAVTMPPDRFRGYTAPGDLAVGSSYGVGTPPDLKETYAIGPVNPPNDRAYLDAAGHFFADNLWPSAPDGLREVLTEYYLTMDELALKLMRLFALALGLPERWFDDKIDRHISPLSAQYYPPITLEPLDGQLRAGMHTDFGSLTIVHRDAAPGGLEIQIDDDWVPAPHVPDSFTVNLGDLMAEWTNDRWVSTVHRVAVPDAGPDRATSRLALCFFHQPNFDAIVSAIPTCVDAAHPARHEPTTSGEHYYAKIRKMRGLE